MKAAVWYGYKDLRIEQKDIPAPKAGYVKIKIAYAGICGTDRHEYVGPNFIPVSKPHRLTGCTAPLVIGHEFSGIIEEIGENVADWQIGDRVSANGTLCCKECDMCKSGRYNVCEKLGFLGVGIDGVFAEYANVEADRLFKIPNNVTLCQAAIAEPLACGIHATRLMGNVKDTSVVIVGPGIIGLGCMMAAKIAGAKKILVAGRGTNKQIVAEKYGATYIDISKVDLNQAVLDWNQGNNADIVYECVGKQQSLDSCISVLKPGGKLMVMGVFEEKPIFDMNTFQEGERKLYTSQAHLDEIGVALDYMSKGLINADELITRQVTLDTLVVDGFEELILNSSNHIKIVIKIND